MTTPPPDKAPVRGVTVDVDRGSLLRDGREIRLRAKTFQVLLYLHEHQGRLVTKDDLLRVAWPDTFVTDDSLTKCIGEIREALADRDHQLLKTVARRGFILDAPLTTARHARAEPMEVLPERSGPRRHNLPAPLTSFIGREAAIAELVQQLPAARLLTLTGAGGCGKTRLALEVARQVLDTCPDGVWLADLAPLGDPSLVAQSVADALGVRQAAGRSLVESMTGQLRHRRLLLLLDNCEHVIAAAAELAHALLRAAPTLTILATSREALGVEGERRWRVPSLAVPHPGLTRPDDLLQFEAVRLLVERAAAAGTTLAVTSENAGTIVEVCRRLDGIPLGLELVAARLKILSIEQISERLDDRFRLLTVADRAPIGRQRTLEATMAWSYDLLTEPERHVLRALSAFAGGWTLEAAEHVCAGGGAGGDTVLDLMDRLADKSLVIVDEDSDARRRYQLLETVRHYARERLHERGEADVVRARHFECFLGLAREAEPELTSHEQWRWLDRLHHEHANFRAALEWGLESGHRNPEGLELAIALYWFWLKRAYLAEGRHWLERALARAMPEDPARRAQALMAIGSIVFFQGDFARADSLLDESAALASSAGESSIVAFARGLQTMAAMERGDLEAAGRLATESSDAGRAAGQPWLECFSLSYFAYEALYAGDVELAGKRHERALALVRARGELWGMGIVLFDLALLRIVQQRFAEARALSAEGIALGEKFADRRAIAWCLGVLAGADAAEGHPVRAARLRGAMEGLLDSIGAFAQPTYHAWIGDRLFPEVQRQLGEEAYRQALAAGRAMSLSEATRYALQGSRERLDARV